MISVIQGPYTNRLVKDQPGGNKAKLPVIPLLAARLGLVHNAPMSDLLQTRMLAKSFAVQTLFEELNLSISADARIGVIGPNGSGKSTLLKILAAIETPDEGSVVCQKGLKLTYVPQMQVFKPRESVGEFLHHSAAAVGIPLELRPGEVNRAMGMVGLTREDQPVGELSGGWQKRLLIGRCFLGEPDLVLLDEPTNHLDMAGIWWLEGLLHRAPFAWMAVSHDRYFLQKTARRVLELNPIFQGGVLANDGDYHSFMRKRAQTVETMDRQRSALANKARRETAWLKAGVKARTTKAKYRIDAAHALLDELEDLKGRKDPRAAGIAFEGSGRRTRRLVEVRRVAKSLGDKCILTGLDMNLAPGKRCGLLGVNGSGKTTVLKLLMGELEPDGGRVKHAPELKMVYFDQERAQLDPTMAVSEALAPTGSDSVVYRGREIHLLSWAKRFRFTRDHMPLPVGQLSGGEQARLLIARLMLQPADVLLLDEPTNDLDIPTLEILEESLRSFPGALVLVTHDRFMLGRVCNQFMGLDGRGSVKNYGDVGQWERDRKKNKSAKSQGAKTQVQAKQPKKQKLSYMEQREFDRMEEKILEAEDRVQTCKQAAEDPAIASNGAKLMEAHEALTKAESEVARLYDRWSDLSEKAGVT